MTLELHCGDVIPGCEGVVRGDTRDEVLSQAAAHAATAHALTDIDADTGRALAAAIHDAPQG